MTDAKLPLSKHPNGQWYKKVKGKVFYFGTDYDEAVDKWLNAKDHILAGRGKPKESTSPTIVELANLYHDGCRQRVSSGDLTETTLKEAEVLIKRLVAFRGELDHPGDWLPLDFKEIKQWLFEPVKRTTAIRGGVKQAKVVTRRSSITVDGDIRRIKAFLNWCKDARLIPPPDYGQEFSQSSKRQQRLAKVAAGSRVFEPAELRAIIDASTITLKPCILLGINGGMGMKDIAQLTLDQVEGVEWLDCPRMKTGAPRRIWLWPETRLAITDYLEKRVEPLSEKLKPVAFLTKYRTAWVRDTHDAASKVFKSTRETAGVDRGTFYDLRRTFQTVGDETLDFPAVKFCMGHVASASDMSAKYREVSDARVKRVCERVHEWLYSVD